MDLGVIFNTNSKWKNQIITASNKANQMLGRIKKPFASFDRFNYYYMAHGYY